MRVVLLGLPAAGKGTQGDLLSEQLGVPHISTGKMFREAIDSDTPLGVKVRSFMERGELVPDDLAIEIVVERLNRDDCAKGFILDGFPRTVPQAISLDRALPELGVSLQAGVNIAISEEEAIRRIADRLVCRQCEATYNRKLHAGLDACEECGGPLVHREDDTEETARNRLRVYLEQTHPVVGYYRDRGILATVDGERPIQAVFHSILGELRKAGVLKSTGVPS